MTPKQFNELQRQADAIEQHKKWLESQAITLQTESESKAIPELSDEEIESMRIEYFKENGIWAENSEIFIKGAKAYREQLKQRQ